jgi:hypothetical protein
MSVERRNHQGERPYLCIHPTDTDNHAAQKVLFIDMMTNRIVGPTVENGGVYSVDYEKPEVFEFDGPEGLSAKYMVKSIEGVIGFTHEYEKNGDLKQSSPVRVDFTSGHFIAIDQKTHEEWKQEFVNSNIALQIHQGDTITEIADVLTTSSVFLHTKISSIA